VPNDSAESPSVQAEVNPSTATLGDVLTLKLRVNYPNGYTVAPPVFDKNLGTFEVRASTQLPAQVEGPRTIARFEAALQNFTTGPQLLPGLELPYQDIEGHSHVLKTPALTVTLQNVPAGPKDKGDIRGIKGVVGPVAWSPWWWAVALFLLAALCLLLWHKRKRALAGPPPPPPIPADREALARLQELRASGWLEAGKLKEFYSRLSDIVRAYIEKGFDVPALERTTAELMRDLRRRAVLSADRLIELQTLLDECDLVKFAKYRPETQEALLQHAAAVRFIEETRDALDPIAPGGKP
jgi:hypothetical protein